MVDKQGASHRAEDQASGVADFMVVEDSTGVADLVVAGAGNRGFVMFPGDRELCKWRDAICGGQS